MIFSAIKNFLSNSKIPNRIKNKCYIIGGGPSVNDINLSRLIDGDIITINKSIEYIDYCHIFLTMDYSFLDTKLYDKTLIFIEKYETKFIQKFIKIKYD
jgi:hypothetical protein